MRTYFTLRPKLSAVGRRKHHQDGSHPGSGSLRSRSQDEKTELPRTVVYIWTTVAPERYKKEEEEFKASLGYLGPRIKREKEEREVKGERSVKHYFLVNLGRARSTKWRECGGVPEKGME